MIKAIIFDNNGVLSASDEETTLGNLCNFFNLTVEEIDPIWKENAKSLDEGKITTEDFHKNVLAKLNSKKTIEELRKVHLGSYPSKQDVQEFALELSKRFKLALLSNFGDCFDECNKYWQLERIFGDDMIVSCKVHMRKPNSDIFEYTLKRLGLRPEETIFIDDKDDNIEESSKLGMNAIKFTSLEKLKEDLARYGVMDEVLR